MGRIVKEYFSIQEFRDRDGGVKVRNVKGSEDWIRGNENTFFFSTEFVSGAENNFV
jgi:hypothetical protein